MDDDVTDGSDNNDWEGLVMLIIGRLSHFILSLLFARRYERASDAVTFWKLWQRASSATK